MRKRTHSLQLLGATEGLCCRGEISKVRVHVIPLATLEWPKIPEMNLIPLSGMSVKTAYLAMFHMVQVQMWATLPEIIVEVMTAALHGAHRWYQAPLAEACKRYHASDRSLHAHVHNQLMHSMLYCKLRNVKHGTDPPRCRNSLQRLQPQFVFAYQEPLGPNAQNYAGHLTAKCYCMYMYTPLHFANLALENP